MDEHETGLDSLTGDAIRDRFETYFMRHFRAMDSPLRVAIGEHEEWRRGRGFAAIVFDINQ